MSASVSEALDRNCWATTPTSVDTRSRRVALIVVCLGSLMIVLDTTIVNVALPSIRESLGFSLTSLAWVVNAYTLSFGGLLLLAGRLGDVFGRRRLFMAGVALFTAASLACGLSGTPAILIGARAVQGFGAAIVSAVSLSIITSLFVESTERAKAMGVFGFVAAGGGSIGVLIGGVLTGLFNWHWVFLVNVPIGVGVYALSLRVLPAGEGRGANDRLDVKGALIVTSALLAGVYGVVNADQAGWLSSQTLSLLGSAVALLVAFIVAEARTTFPLVPLRLFRRRNLAMANVVGILWAATLFAWFFLSALYLQLVLGYNALHVGLAFLPESVIMAAMSLGISAKLVTRFGLRTPLASGLVLAAAGLLLLTRAPVGGHYATDVLPSMVLLGLASGTVFNPLLLAAMGEVQPSESGIASGLVNSSFMMGGALGLAVLASASNARVDSLLASGHGRLVALDSGYHVAFWAGTVFALLAAYLSAFQLQPPRPAPTAVATDDAVPRLDDADHVELSSRDQPRGWGDEIESSASTYVSGRTHLQIRCRTAPGAGKE